MKFSIGSIFLLMSFFVQGQLTPFAIINDKDGFTNIRYGSSKKVVDKIYSNQVFAVRGMVDTDGWQDWRWIDYPDYKLAKKPFDKFINKTKEGMMHTSRMILLSDLPQWKNQHIDSSLICSKGNTSIHIRYGAFNRKEHTFTQNTDGIIFKIDGSEPWGIDGEITDGLTEIKSITIKQGGRLYTFPKEAIKNLFQPNIILGNFGVAEGSNNTIFLYMSNSDGAGGYDVVWTIQSGKVVSQYLYRNF